MFQQCIFTKSSHLYFLGPLPQNHLVSIIQVSLLDTVLILTFLLFLHGCLLIYWQLWKGRQQLLT